MRRQIGKQRKQWTVTTHVKRGNHGENENKRVTKVFPKLPISTNKEITQSDYSE